MDVTERLRRYKRDRSGYAEYCHQAADEIDRLRKQRDFLLSAARRTLAENAHLADGDVCTLLALKRAVEALAKVGAGRTAKHCDPCRETGAIHCSDPENCGGPWDVHNAGVTGA